MRPIVVHTGAPRSPVAGLPIARVGIALLVAWCGCAGPGTRELSLAPLAGQHAGQSVVRRPGQHVEQTRERDLLWPLINQR